MFISIVSKNGEPITKENKLFENKKQHDRFWDWAWESISYIEAKLRVEKLGYTVWDGDKEEFGLEIPEKVSRFQIWRRVDSEIRKPEVIEFEGMTLKIKVS